MVKANILIVEDEAIIASVIEAALKKFGYGITAILNTGEAAISKAIELKPDLILMDIRLQGTIDGILAGEKINSQADIPIIYLTAYADDPTLERAKKTKPFGFIPKPFQEVELKTAIEMALYKHRFESQLKASEARFRALFENSHDFIYIADANDRMLVVNPAGVKRFGYARREMLARTVGELYQNRDDREACLSELRENNLVIDRELKLKRKDGRILLCLETAHMLTDENGRILGIQGVIRDVTEKRKNEQTLLLLQTAINSSSEAVLITDRMGNIVYANQAFETITGYGAVEALGRNPRLLSSGSQTRDFYREMWDTILGGRSWQGEFINRKKDGTLYSQRSSISPVFEPNGSIANFVGISTDITQEKKLEEHLQQAVKMDSLGRLAGGIAHDFNNLLTVISGYGELLLNQLGEGGQRENVRNIVHAAQKAAALTGQILSFSRKQIAHAEMIHLDTVLEEFRKMIGRILGEDIELKIILANDLAPVFMDVSQVEQVILNIVVNARDAMPAGGKLTIEARNFTVDDDFVRNQPGITKGKFVRLNISDNGHGMSTEVREHIFEPFFTTKRLGEGTGLGLATVYGIVKQASGHILVESAVGKGTTFSIFLPSMDVKGEYPEKLEAGLSGDSLPRGKETILAVEDEAGILELIVFVLGDLGYTVLTASGSDAAKDKVRECRGKIDLLLTDVVLPEIRGPQLVEEMQKWIPGIKVVLMSGYTEDRIASEQIGAGRVRFLAKPFTPQTLAKIVRQALDEKDN